MRERLPCGVEEAGGGVLLGCPSAGAEEEASGVAVTAGGGVCVPPFPAVGEASDAWEAPQ